VCNLYGVWRKKKMAGREYMGVVRTTFLIDPDGKIAQVWEKVRVNGHADEVLRACCGAV
jgi:peroxiredoxin Q/BCP